MTTPLTYTPICPCGNKFITRNGSSDGSYSYQGDQIRCNNCGRLGLPEPARESWYTSNSPINNHGQGLIASETDGRNIAVCYDIKDAPILAASLDLLAACREFIQAYDEDGFNSIKNRSDAITKIRAAIAKAEGN